MREKRKRYFVITVVFLLVIPVFLCAGAFLLPRQYGETYMGALKSKQIRLKETKGRRMVFLGGSNLVFGLDSETIEKSFADLQVVNYGMYAALGTTVLYELAEKELREGDLVILSPEQDGQTLSEYFNPEVMWQGVDGAYEMLPLLDREKLGEMTGALPGFAREKWLYFLKQEKPEPEGVYRRENFNRYGDLESEMCAQNIMQNGYDANQQICFDKEIVDPEFIQTTNAWIHRLQEKGVTVWYRFPPMNQKAVENVEEIDAYTSWLAEQLDCEIVGDPADSVMEAEWFYDTNFHLNRDGRIRYTDQLIRDLKAMLGDASPTVVRKVEKPALLKEEIFQGVDTDADCFVFEKKDDGFRLTGLTQEGLEKKELIVPSYIEDTPVAEIEDTVFAGAKELETVTIQQNIRFLPDGLFGDCGKLRFLILSQISPEKISVGQKLLEGTKDVKILVEKEFLNQYKTDYSWGEYRGSLEG